MQNAVAAAVAAAGNNQLSSHIIVINFCVRKRPTDRRTERSRQTDRQIDREGDNPLASYYYLPDSCTRLTHLNE